MLRGSSCHLDQGLSRATASGFQMLPSARTLTLPQMHPFPGPRRPFLSGMHHSSRRCLAYVPGKFRMNGRRKVLSCFPDFESNLRINVACSALPLPVHTGGRKCLRGSLRRSRAAFPHCGVSSSSPSKASPRIVQKLEMDQFVSSSDQ